MDPKDAINYALSTMAVLMSSSALIFAVVFQRSERKRNIRQTLTSTLNEIAGINVELSKSAKEKDQNETDRITVWKNYNSQRSILITDADFLIHENYKIVTATDCSLLAGTYSAIGYFQKAKYFWSESIKKSDNNIVKHINIRDYASFLFQQNHFEEGREQFERALNVKLGDTDDELRFLIDTYLMWAKLERSFGDEQEFKKLTGLARKINKKIRHNDKRNGSGSMIDIVTGEKKERQNSNAEAASA